MIKNYFITALRNFLKNKTYSLINIIGFAVGMACFMLIVLYVINELSYDRHFDRAGDIYRITIKGNMSGNEFEAAVSGGTLGMLFKEELPEVEEYTRLIQLHRPVLFTANDKQIYQDNIMVGDSTVFEFFSHTFISGDPETALDEPNTLVLTESTARKYFGDDEAVGSYIKWNNDKTYKVTGIIRNEEKNSHMPFDVMVSLSSLNDHPVYSRFLNNLSAFVTFNYVRLYPGIDGNGFQDKIDDLIQRHMGEMMEESGATIDASLQPITSIHLHSDKLHELAPNGDIRKVYLFSAIALLILLIACINFINLSTARATTRAKEVGLRKVFGAYRFMLIRQFLGEAMLITLISLALAFLIVELVLPSLDLAVGITLKIPGTTKLIFFGIMVLLALLIGLFSGLYPSFYLSSYQPQEVIKGGLARSGRKSWFRSIMVIFQYAASIFLICSSLVIYKQIAYMNEKDIGINTNDLVVIPIRGGSQMEKVPVLKGELLNLPGVLDITSSSTYVGRFEQRRAFLPEGRERNDMWMLNYIQADYNYLGVMGINLVEGRDFSETDQGDTASIIINQALQKKLEWDQPLGRYIAIPAETAENDIRYKVIGVMKDFSFASLHQEIKPLLIIMQPERSGYMSVRINPGSLHESLNMIEEEWTSMFPDAPFDYFLQESMYKDLYKADVQTGKIFIYFTLFAIFIASLGLFGLALYNVGQRTREIGIRKVFGGTVTGLVGLLNRELSILVLISCIIAWPTAWFFLDQWLDNFAFHVQMPIWIYIVSGAIAFAIAIITVSYQAFRAASNNPVETLRYE